MEKLDDANDYENTYDDFMNRINIIVQDYLQEHSGNEWHSSWDDKVVNDPIWGCVRYKSYEIAIIDTPLFQRLRDIYQVGLCIFTYPAARHSRFEHSLGVVAIADRMMKSLQEQLIPHISEEEIQEVRLAALLHDIGHCFYSHLSESFYGNLKEFQNIIRYFNNTFKVRPKPHEIFSYLIVNTSAFIDYLKKNNILPSRLVKEANGYESLMKRIGNMIIGVPNKGTYKGQDKRKIYSYSTNIINGDIDADKLDYIKRDGYTCGVPLAFDVERLLYKISIKENRERGEYQLVIDMAGINAVEEMTFSKLMLNHYIYHHQKVLATEAMAKDIALALWELKLVSHPCDFLKYTDKTLEAMLKNEKIPFNSYGVPGMTLGYLIRRVKDRYLPKRCFEINSRILETPALDTEKENDEYRKKRIQECIRNIESANNQDDKEDILESYAANTFEFTEKNKNQISGYRSFISKFSKMTYKEYTQSIRREISKQIAEIYYILDKETPVKGTTPFDVHLVMPKTIDEQMTFSTPIVYRDANEHITTDMFSYMKNWAQAFNSNKWSGYVFVSPHIDVTIAFMATKIVLSKHILGVQFNHPEEFVKHINNDLINKISQKLKEKT